MACFIEKQKHSGHPGSYSLPTASTAPALWAFGRGRQACGIQPVPAIPLQSPAIAGMRSEGVIKRDLTPKLRAEAYRVWHVSRPSRHGTRLVVAAECKFDPSSELRHTGYDPSAELPRRTQPVSSSPVARVRAGAGDREIGGPDGEGIMLRNS
eukprot:scaffold67961_cov21-Tisochrysis_lutea.AAC.1